MHQCQWRRKDRGPCATDVEKEKEKRKNKNKNELLQFLQVQGDVVISSPVTAKSHLDVDHLKEKKFCSCYDSLIEL